ncbi:MAG: hypothetical protein J7L41_06390 [Synergistetes bacterium]|nr:hypothetical protein [Synergistota bacterium]
MCKLWRIHIRPDADPKSSINVCLNQSVIGIGWEVGQKPASEADYMQLGQSKYGDPAWRSNANALLYEMDIDDLVWFRDTDGVYYLARVIGGWQYRNAPANIRADIVNVRPVEICRVGTRVPGKIISSFIPRRTLQRIHDKTALLFSKIVFNMCCGGHYPVENDQEMDIFSLLSAEDLEDVVGLYLQLVRCYVFIPSSRGRSDDTIRYEYELLDRNGKGVLVQVKSGNVVINLDDYKDSKNKYIVFSPAGYTGESSEKVEALSRESIEEFLENYAYLMPFHIKVWIQCCKKEGLRKWIDCSLACLSKSEKGNSHL